MGKKTGCLCCEKGIPKIGPRICPICDHVFKGNGWDGIDAHWRAKHADIMPYTEFWDSLCKAHLGHGKSKAQDDAILNIHRRLFEYLIDADIPFLVRKKSANGRSIESGHYFRGGPHYAQTTFWTGDDVNANIYSIAFVVLHDFTSYLEISGETEEKWSYLQGLKDHIGGFETPSNRKNRWLLHFEGTDYLESLKHVIEEIRPRINQYMSKNPSDYFRPLTDGDCRKYIDRIVSLRDGSPPAYLARICWNDNEWAYPSGRLGKSSSTGTFEGKNGFGHEEWLFDRDKVIDGYHYGFIEALHQSSNHVGEVCDLHLFTLHTGQNGSTTYYVGKILQAECITPAQSKKAYAVYKKEGWRKEMRNQVLAIGGDIEALASYTEPGSFFNVRFKVGAVRRLHELYQLASVPNKRYSKMYKLDGDLEFVTAGGDSAKKYKTTKTKIPFRAEYERDPRHAKIHNVLSEVIKNDVTYKQASIHSEKECVDMRAILPDQSQHFFEIKTSNPLRCIREAIGQIMEYAYFPSEEKASRLIIIGEDAPDMDTVQYLKYVRKRFKIPVFYRQLDLDKKVLSGEY